MRDFESKLLSMVSLPSILEIQCACGKFGQKEKEKSSSGLFVVEVGWKSRVDFLQLNQLYTLCLNTKFIFLEQCWF